MTFVEARSPLVLLGIFHASIGKSIRRLVHLLERGTDLGFRLSVVPSIGYIFPLFLGGFSSGLVTKYCTGD